MEPDLNDHISEAFFPSVFLTALFCIQVGPESGRRFSPLPGGPFQSWPVDETQKRLPGAFISPVDSSLDLYEPSADNLRVIHIPMAQLSGSVKAFSLSFFFFFQIPFVTCASRLKGALKIKENLRNLSAVSANQTHPFMLSPAVCLLVSEGFLWMI